MTYKLPDNLKIELINNKVSNLDSITQVIKEETNVEMLKEYYEFLQSHINPFLYEGIDTILNEIKERISILELNNQEFNDLLNKIQNTYVELDEVIPLIHKYINKQSPTEEEMIKIYSFLSNTITMFEYEYNESLNNKEIEILHYTMDYIKKTNNNLIEQYLIERYDNYCQKELESNGKSNSYSKKLLNPDVPILLDDNGISLTITIITITLVLGLTIATLLLVK